MKRKFTNKLVLNKKTVSNLTNNDMNTIHGGSLLWVCSESCSVIMMCCDTKTNPIEENRTPAKDQD